MEWGLDWGMVGTVIGGASLAWQFAVTAKPYFAAVFDPRCRRWRAAIRAHGFDPITALSRFGVHDAPATVGFDRKALAKNLSPAVLRTTAETLNLRHDWLLGCDDRPYDLMTLDRSFGPLVRELLDWQRIGYGHGILAFKSSTEELLVRQRQFGALVLVRNMGGSDEHPTYAYRPIFSLHSWGEPKQRWLAFRAIWAAWYLTFDVHGYDASESQCDRLREGKLFPGSLRQSWGVGSWRPDDYVVRPSEEAMGDDVLVEAIEREHAAELLAMARAAGRDVRRWGTFRELVVGS